MSTGHTCLRCSSVHMRHLINIIMQHLVLVCKKPQHCHVLPLMHRHMDRHVSFAAGKGSFAGDLSSLTDVFVKANGRLHDLKKQQTDLEAKLGNDYGLEEAFGALVDRCYEAQVWDCLRLNPVMQTVQPLHDKEHPW